MAAQVDSGAACRAIVTGMLVVAAVLVRGVVMAVAAVRRVLLPFAMAEQGRQGSSDALQRHHGERRGQDQFF